MQQFLVPQFIEVENKILGPITVRQFVIMIVVMGTIFIFNKIFDFSAFIVLSLITLAIGGAFAFLKVNGAYFHFFLLNVLQTSLRPHIRTWQKERVYVSKNKKKNEQKNQHIAVSHTKVIKNPLMLKSRLNELSLVVNTGGHYKEEE